MLKISRLILVALLLSTFASAQAQTGSDNSQEKAEIQSLLNRAYTDAKAERYTEALAAYKEAARRDPTNVSAYNGLGFAYAKLKQFREATSAYRRTLELRPNDAYALTQIAYVYLELHEYQMVVEYATRSIQIEPGNAISHSNLGSAQFQLKHYEEAIKALEQAVRLNPNLPRAYNNIGYAHLSLGHYEDAIRALEYAIKLDPKIMQAYNNLGRAYILLGRHKEAVETFKRAISIKPDDFWSHVNLGNVYLNIRQYKEAIEEYKLSTRINDPDQVVAFMGLGTAARRAAEYEQAVDAFTQVLRQRPQEAGVFHARGYAYLYLGRGAQAAADAQKYLELSGSSDKKRSLYVSLLAHFGFRQAGLSTEANQILQEIVAKTDASMWPHPVVRYLLGEVSEQELLSQATDGDKKTEARAYIGMNLLFSGQVEEARTHLQWVRENGNKDFVEYAMAEAELNRLERRSQQQQRGR
jgi:tetratricopeptide (TPR) repeat protein